VSFAAAARRLEALPAAAVAGASDVLDVGCGSGLVAIALAERFPALRSVLGVDADAALVARARELLAVRRRDAALPPPSAALPVSVRQQLIAAGGAGAGAAPAFGAGAGAAAAGVSGGPSVIFREEDFLAHAVSAGEQGAPPPLYAHRAESYDVVLVLGGVSRAIHMRGGDAALLLLFRLVHRALRAGGRFVLEPGSWRGYAKALRGGVMTREALHALRLRPADLERHLIETVRFASAERCGPFLIFVK